MFSGMCQQAWKKKRQPVVLLSQNAVHALNVENIIYPLALFFCCILHELAKRINEKKIKARMEHVRQEKRKQEDLMSRDFIT